MFEIEFSFEGEEASSGLIDFYDVARAIAGFQRSLALTTHLVLNGEVITQAPSLHGARILAPAFEEGSWKTKAKIFIGTAIAVGSVGRDSPVGQIVTSVYDYVLSSTMGFHHDYDKTLQQQFYEHFERKKITAEKLDSLIEKIEPSVAEMHRPIIISKTATIAKLQSNLYLKTKIGPDLNNLTYDYVKQTIFSKDLEEIFGYVSSYNINTYKGRIFCESEGRPISFELSDNARFVSTVGILTNSQHFNGQKRFDIRARIKIKANRLNSNTGRLKRLVVHSAEVA